MKPSRGLAARGAAAGALTALLLASSLIAVTEEAAAPSDPAEAPSCSLQHHPDGDKVQPCTSPGDSLPPRLDALLKSDKISPEFRTAAAAMNFGTVSPAVMGDIPVLLLLHLSAGSLSTSAPRALSAIIRKHPKDVVVAKAVLTALDLADNEKRTRFIRELGLTSGLSLGVQSAIAASTVHWWGPELEQHSMDLAMVGSPLLAALPPGYLAELDSERTAKMLMRLRNHPWESPDDPSWSSQSPETKRVWMTMFKKDDASGKGQLINSGTDGLKMLWAGATPDEIADLQFVDTDRRLLTRLSHLTKLQTRAFLAKLYPTAALSSLEMNELFSWALDFSPAGLQRFLANDTDFSNLPAADTSRASLPTLKQVLEQVVATMVIQGRIEEAGAPGTWARRIKDVGRLAYLIRADRLANYSQHQLPADVLTALDTYKLSSLQARCLTNNGKFLDLQRPLKDLEGLHGLTLALSTGRLASLRTSTVSNDVMNHLLESLPATNLGRASVLFNKMRASLSEPKVLEAVLRNPSPGQFWALVSSREVAAEREALEKALSRTKAPVARSRGIFDLGMWIDQHLNKKDGIEEHLRFLPQDTLSAVLGSARRELASSSNSSGSVVWTSDTLLAADRPLVRGALLGLTCADVIAMDLVDLPVIVAALNRRVEEAGVAFPKRLQHCLQRAMEDYLAIKKRMRQYHPDVPLIEVLEPSDIEAFGGYLLSALRPGLIQQSHYAKLILSSIGSLSPQELLAAAPSLERLREFALQLVDLYRATRSVGPRCLFALGNLHMFLPPDVITAIEPDAWKLFVEARAGRPLSLAVCGGSEQRDAWHRLTVRAFGSPSLWSAGVVAALGDVMAALPGDVLLTVRMPNWRDAADTLAERTVYHRPTGVAGSDQPRPFVEVCRSLLSPEEQSSYYWSVRRVARLYLRAAQWLLDTVEDADKLVRRLMPRSSRPHFAISHHRQAAVVTTTTEAPTTTSSTTTTTEVTTTEDPFGNFDDFLTSKDPWLVSALSTLLPVPQEPPKTVIVDKDPASTTSAAETTTAWTTDGPSTVPTAAASLPELKSWDESDVSQSTSAPSTSSATSPLTERASERSDGTPAPQSVDSLPALTTALYPNQSTSGGQLNLSATTAKYSAELADKEEALAAANVSTIVPAVAGERKGQDGLEDPEAAVLAENKVRRRRSDAAEDEMEHQISRDVQVQVTCDALRVLGAASSLAIVNSDPEHMLDSEVSDCVEELGAVRLGASVARDFWTKIPEKQRLDWLGDMGQLVQGMPVDEVPRLNLSLAHENVLDTLSVVGSHVTDRQCWTRWRRSWSSRTRSSGRWPARLVARRPATWTRTACWWRWGRWRARCAWTCSACCCRGAAPCSTRPAASRESARAATRPA
ncbi:uncharacterized protein LOC117651725 isoform X2 [Thrips palmi]|uniref:Uncharacterized protein LOC117651725 isoform X2 n=1 Tax=Thrips palmi TaxID=161013 RepID=A0A6P9A5X1_THRPL|nr:uncharacterized protein LOC117651725 isoform X2 [Thrips palmi]